MRQKMPPLSSGELELNHSLSPLKPLELHIQLSLSLFHNPVTRMLPRKMEQIYAPQIHKRLPSSSGIKISRHMVEAVGPNTSIKPMVMETFIMPRSVDAVTPLSRHRSPILRPSGKTFGSMRAQKS